MKYLDSLIYHALRRCYPRSIDAMQKSGVDQVSCLDSYSDRMERITESKDWRSWRDLTIVDFGCGYGDGAIEMAKCGIGRVVGVDIREDVLAEAKGKALAVGVGEVCEFVRQFKPGAADVIISMDAFEHFADPESVLELMARYLSDGGRVVTSFGPTWFHPRGGHLFSMFPWAHLLLSESALCRWRRDFRRDGAEQFHEVEGGLNRMTIRRFEKLVAASPFQIERWSPRPIGPLRLLHNRWTREFTTSVIDCVLVRS